MIVFEFFRQVFPSSLRRIFWSGCIWMTLSLPMHGAESGGMQPGFARVPNDLVDQGELLLGELNCVACHQAEASVKARLASKQAPLLAQSGLAITPQYLRK